MYYPDTYYVANFKNQLVLSVKEHILGVFSSFFFSFF